VVCQLFHEILRFFFNFTTLGVFFVFFHDLMS
jgi:hypothetical protein